MSKTTLNESQLKNLIKTSIKNALNEMLDNYSDPTACVWYNAETKKCSSDIEGDGNWYSCNLIATDSHLENDGIVVDDAEVDEIDEHYIVRNGEMIESEEDDLTPEDCEIIVDYAINNDLFS